MTSITNVGNAMINVILNSPEGFLFSVISVETLERFSVVKSLTLSSQMWTMRSVILDLRMARIFLPVSIRIGLNQLANIWELENLYRRWHLPFWRRAGVSAKPLRQHWLYMGIVEE